MANFIAQTQCIFRLYKVVMFKIFNEKKMIQTKFNWIFSSLNVYNYHGNILVKQYDYNSCLNQFLPLVKWVWYKMRLSI